jgi:hypothetical protein
MLPKHSSGKHFFCKDEIVQKGHPHKMLCEGIIFS